MAGKDPEGNFYRCDDNQNRDEHCEQVRHAQVYEYFFSGFREHLYTLTGWKGTGGKIESLRHYRLAFDGVEGLAIRLDADPANGKPAFQVPLRDVSLYRYYNGVLVLGIRVALNNQLETSRCLTEPDWWKALVFPQNHGDRELPVRQVNRLLRYSKLVRQLFAAFAEQLRESKIGAMQLVYTETGEVKERTAVGDPFNGIVKHFLWAFFPRISCDDWTRERRFRHLIDDRMFVSLAYSLAGRPPRPESGGYDRMERLFSLALYVDEASDGYELARGYAYDQTFIEELKAGHRLTRWDRIGTREGVTPYSMVTMGQSPYFNSVILATHVPYIYTRILIVLLLYRTTLYQFDRRITRATEELTQRKRPGTFRRMRQDFIQFTNIYWLRELTPQIQGRELTDRAVEVLRLEPKYALLKDEMERADEFTAARRDQRFSIVALVLAVIAILITFDDELCPFSDAVFRQIVHNASLLGLVLILLYVTIWPALKAFFKRLFS